MPEVIDKMTANDPVDELDRYLAQPERLSAILIYHGNRDQLTPVEQARDFDKLLTDRGVEHEYLKTNAGHCDFGYLGYIPIVKFMSDDLAGEELPNTPSPVQPTLVRPAATGDIKLTIVYDNSTTDPQLKPEQGFSAVVETGGHMLLFDTGTNGSVLLDNMRQLGIDPQSIEAVILSHDHIDHTGGLQALLDLGIRPMVYVPSKLLEYSKAKVRAQTELIEVENALEILPGVHTTRPIGSVIEQALVLETRDGAVVITGCAHPGVVNMVREAQAVAGPKIALLAGGFHLGDTSESKLPLIVAEVRQAGVSRVMPSHCTGKKAIALFRSEYGENYVEGGVGRTVTFSTK